MIKIKKRIKAGRAHYDIKIDYKKDKFSGLERIYIFTSLDRSVSETIEKKNEY